MIEDPRSVLFFGGVAPFPPPGAILATERNAQKNDTERGSSTDRRRLYSGGAKRGIMNKSPMLASGFPPDSLSALTVHRFEMLVQISCAAGHKITLAACSTSNGIACLLPVFQTCRGHSSAPLK